MLSHRLTLQQYKDMLAQLLAVYDVQLGEFHNMIIDGDWGAIRHSVHIINKQSVQNIEQGTMEFVHFKDNPEPVGARVIEGWALSDKPITDQTSGGKNYATIECVDDPSLLEIFPQTRPAGVVLHVARLPLGQPVGVIAAVRRWQRCAGAAAEHGGRAGRDNSKP